MLNLNSRQAKLLRLIQEQQTIAVGTLIEQVDASPATIRKDLVSLEELGAIRRTRGEAHAAQSSPALMPIGMRYQSHTEEKRMIAREAVKLIEDGDTIILDSGSTTMEIALLLEGFHGLTVLTHSMDIASLLSRFREVTVVLPGGVLNGETQSLIGPYTESFFTTIEASKLFLSSSGVRGRLGFTVTKPFEISIKKNAIQAAKQVIAVLDSSKFSSPALNLFAGFEDVDVIITNPVELAPPVLDAIDRNGVRIIWAQ